MKLSLDTDAAIEVLRGRQPHYRAWMQKAEAEGSTLHLSSIVFHELMFGAMSSARPEHQMERVAWLASAMDVHPWTPDDAMEAARIRADLQKIGFGIGAFDALIAGQACNNGWTLVTGNVREFFRVQNLQLQNWSDPAGPIDRAGMQRWLVQKPTK